MPHPLVLQLRFTRYEFLRGLEGLKEEEAQKRFLPMNSISWNIGHLTWQEQRYFLFYAQNCMPLPEIDQLFRYGGPASTPQLGEMIDAWKMITQMADRWLDALTVEKPEEFVVQNGRLSDYFNGSMLQRVIYHYWYHNGENQAIRQMLSHTDLPEFVGDLDKMAPYQRE